MGALIADVLDFSRGHLGSGISVQREPTSELGAVINSVIDEVRVSHPHVSLIRNVSIGCETYCDLGRVGQLLSNLLVNAITHGCSKSPIQVTVTTECNELVLSVTNQGEPIEPELLPSLFRPFTRSETRGRGEGLGLGLYIAEQIVAGHEGTLSVSSTAEAGTTFVARWPIAQLAVLAE
ncbi:MAG: HAMP domain-containing sensor histidine kinase [Halopseudomonas sp.]|uniref:sensor histidine kinase n=1 Tax=Halopseudomonas sp. TaxID=2901191 RepID=UPI0030013527